MDLNGLPADLEQFVQQEIADGRFASVEEVVSAALRMMCEHQSQTNGQASQLSVRQSDPKLATLKELVRELEALPVARPDDGFSVRDHDKLLYGQP